MVLNRTKPLFTSIQKFNHSFSNMTAGCMPLESERENEREQREVTCLKKTVLALLFSSKKGNLVVSLDVSEIGF